MPSQEVVHVIFSIQSLRGIAAVMVIFVHIGPQLDHFGGPSLPWLLFGNNGVDIFFVISGFIIWVTSQNPTMTSGDFLLRRAIRVIPLYWLVTAFLVSVALLAPTFMSSTEFQLGHVLKSFLFIPALHPVLHEIYPILVPGWSLNYEIFFYLLFGVALLVTHRIGTFISVLGILVVLVVVGMLTQPTSVIGRFYTDPIVLEFAFGMIVGLFHTHMPRFVLWPVVPSIFFGISIPLFCGLAGWINVDNRVMLAGLPSAFLLFALSTAKRHQFDPKISALDLLGDASYSIYLTHVIALPIFARIWKFAGLGFDGGRLPAFIISEILAAVAAGVLAHHVVEKPLLKFMRRLQDPKKKAVYLEG